MRDTILVAVIVLIVVAIVYFMMEDHAKREGLTAAQMRRALYHPLGPTAVKTFLPGVSTSVPADAYVRVKSGREGFCWGGESSRENYRSSGMSGDVDGSDHAGGAGPSDADFCAAGRTALDSRRGFAPDCPGACTNLNSQQQKHGVASNYEYEALRVLNGEV